MLKNLMATATKGENEKLGKAEEEAAQKKQEWGVGRYQPRPVQGGPASVWAAAAAAALMPPGPEREERGVAAAAAAAAEPEKFHGIERKKDMAQKRELPRRNDEGRQKVFFLVQNAAVGRAGMCAAIKG